MVHGIPMDALCFPGIGEGRSVYFDSTFVQPFALFSLDLDSHLYLMYRIFAHLALALLGACAQLPSYERPTLQVMNFWPTLFVVCGLVPLGRQWGLCTGIGCFEHAVCAHEVCGEGGFVVASGVGSGGDPETQYNLGNASSKVRGMAQESSLVSYWFCKAAEHYVVHCYATQAHVRRGRNDSGCS